VSADAPKTRPDAQLAKVAAKLPGPGAPEQFQPIKLRRNGRSDAMQLPENLRDDTVTTLGGQLENVERFGTQATSRVHFQTLLSPIQSGSYGCLIQPETHSYFDPAQVLDYA
jgi:hypothetical protein